MDIIEPQSDNLERTTQPINIDEKIIGQLAEISFKCSKQTEMYFLRDQLYSSKYNAKGLESKERDLEIFLQSLNNQQVRHANQNKEYKWVKINTENMGQIANRFYIAPNPENMHEIVKKLIEVFTLQKIPVRFKYQLTTGMEQCDRIIIYSDYNNKDKVEAAIKKVYQENQSLFDGCERSIAWLYGTSIPHVYSTPETPGEAYSNILTKVIIEAKDIFNYLYGITNSNTKIILNNKNADQAIYHMKLLITSLMLRNGILLSKDGNRITVKDKDIRTIYDFETGILKNSNMDERGYYEAQFYPTLEGKSALFDNFYNVSNIEPQNGVIIRHLTVEERKEEIKRNLYPSMYSDTGQPIKR